eukprot:TRINITY_DN248_c0_g1_i1.p1 TRINITY_DN248_c0_g1~~TRINITY_DN248_c0_g1_i1.p1  ORF type:complete len:209 (-),score=55.09 TRINITY_DN248_c0_g1_i1:88-714(-)
MAWANEKQFKIVVLGDSSVGKSSLLGMYCKNVFVEGQYKSTLGADFLTKTVNHDGTDRIIQMWDTAGQERFASLCIAFYRGADGLILMYDITNPDSVASMDTWASQFFNAVSNGSESFPVIVLGNKLDLLVDDENDNEVINSAKNWAIENNYDHHLVTATDYDRVNEGVMILIQRVFDEYTVEEALDMPRVQIDGDIEMKKKKEGCSC